MPKFEQLCAHCGKLLTSQEPFCSEQCKSAFEKPVNPHWNCGFLRKSSTQRKLPTFSKPVVEGDQAILHKGWSKNKEKLYAALRKRSLSKEIAQCLSNDGLESGSVAQVVVKYGDYSDLPSIAHAIYPGERDIYPGK